MSVDQNEPLPSWVQDELKDHAHHVPFFLAELRGEEANNVILVGIIPGGQKVYLEATRLPNKARANRRAIAQLEGKVTALQARNGPVSN